MTDAVFDSIAAPPAADPPAALSQPAHPREPFRFTGDAREYFRIWIVNLFLTVVTLGIYSAWAKVRKKRYFYGNTWVAGSNFEYHGNAVAILKGRLIAFAAFVAYTLASGFSPTIAAWVLLAFMPLLPWLLVRSMAFNAVNSSYRNLRFHFDGNWREAALALAPLGLVPVAGLLMPEPSTTPEKMADMWPFFVPTAIFLAFYPYVMGSIKRLTVNRSRYGDGRFSCDATIGSFYWIYTLAFLLMAVMMMTFSLVLPIAFLFPDAGWVAFPALYLVLGAVVMGYTQSRVANLVFGAARLEAGLRFSSTISGRRLARLYAENLLAIAGTLGLAIPWACVRVARYRMECLTLDKSGELLPFTGIAARQVAATSEAMGEMFEIDLSL
jgi:uncharacterized membrane protein YjgN (DUF898 family)